jgi:hypothetical protein
MELLSLLSFEENPDPPRYSKEAVSGILNHLAQSWKIDVTDLIYKNRNSDRIPKIIHHLIETFSSSHRKTDRVKAFRSFSFFVQTLKDKIYKPGIFRDVVFSTMRFFSEGSILNDACELLRDVCVKALPHKDKAKELGRHLSVLVATLIPLAQEKHRSGRTKPSGPLKLLTELIDDNDSHATIRDAICALDPFPDEDIFAEINQKFRKMRGKGDLESEIHRFLKNQKQFASSTLPSSVAAKVNRLRHLKQELRSKRFELNKVLQTLLSSH